MIISEFSNLIELLQYRTVNQPDQNVYALLHDGAVEIVEPTSLRRCPDGQVGEVWVAEDSFAQGCWSKSKQSQQIFQAYLADTGKGPFWRTGDLGMWLNGQVVVTGRLKDVLIIQGQNYYPQDIEHTVEQAHSGLRSGRGAVFTVEVKGRERLVVVQEVKRCYLRNLNVVEIVQVVRQAIAEHHNLQVYAILLLKTGTMPKTAKGKIQRQTCKQGFQNHTLNVVGDWLENPRHKTGLIQLETALDKLEQQVAQVILSQKRNAEGSNLLQ